jgi:hypothetical protein
LRIVKDMPVEKVVVTPGVRKYFSALGKRGFGAAKVRTPEQCRAAAQAGWKKRKAKSASVAKPTL